MNRSVAENTTLDMAERQRVIHAVIKNLKAHYFDPGVAQKMGDALLAHENITAMTPRRQMEVLLPIC